MVNENVNQTQFGQDEPIFEDTSAPVAPQATAITRDEIDEDVKQKRKIPLFIVFGIGAVVLISSLIALALLRQPAEDPVVVLPDATPTPSVAPSAFAQEIVDLENSWNAADPISNQVPFPPVEIDISLNE